MAHTKETKEAISKGVIAQRKAAGTYTGSCEEKPCKGCEKPFKPSRKNLVYCSKECKPVSQTERERKQSEQRLVANFRRGLKQRAVEFKGGKCEICGYDKCPAAFDFHHKNPAEKDFAISANGGIRSWEKMAAELEKCLLLCANCHRELHYNEKNKALSSSG